MSGLIFFVAVRAYDSKIKKDQHAWILKESEKTLDEIGATLKANETIDEELRQSLIRSVDEALGRVETFKAHQERTADYTDPTLSDKPAPRLV